MIIIGTFITQSRVSIFVCMNVSLCMYCRSLWSSPLLVSTDVYNMTEEKKSILLNKEVLAIHSDPFFKAGERLMKDEETGLS